MKLNRRHLRRFRRLRRADDADVMFELLAGFPHVRTARLSNGYNGSVRVTCHDGKHFYENARSQGPLVMGRGGGYRSTLDFDRRDRLAVMRCAIPSTKYWRKRNN
jgi:hypothetical protein